jgi:hypothetical protein
VLKKLSASKIVSVPKRQTESTYRRAVEIVDTENGIYVLFQAVAAEVYIL